jgi:hypothetical protein
MSMAKLASGAIAGAALGAFYAGIRGALSYAGAVKLDPQPECFSDAAYDIFSRLHRFRERSPEADRLYRQLILSTDSLLKIESVLRQGVPAKFDDNALATAEAIEARQTLDALVVESKANGAMGADLAVLASLKAEVWELLYLHLMNIRRMTVHIKASTYSASLPSFRTRVPT